MRLSELEMDSSSEKLNTLLKQVIEARSFRKLVCSKADKAHEYIKTEVTPYLDKSVIRYKVSEKTQTQDFTKTLGDAEFIEFVSQLMPKFAAINLHFDDGTASLMRSKSGKSSLVIKKLKASDPSGDDHIDAITDHNRQKNYAVSASAPYMEALGIVGSNGLVLAPMQKKFRQINRFIELIGHTIGDEEVIRVADMGSGKGYLTFALYEYLNHRNQHSKVTGYELREDLVTKCNLVAKDIRYAGLLFEQTDISDADTGPMDMLIALHACDIATDMAIKKGLDANAKYIILSPCCHKQIRKQMKAKDIFTEHGIYEERLAEMITDIIRCQILQYYGYKTSIIEFISAEHTGKNSMIIARKIDTPSTASLDQVKLLKDKYGIKQHYLELLCGLD